MQQHPSFFWERKTHSGRSRFNLLLLEHGEYFFEDLSVYLFPVPDPHSGKAFHHCDALKIQGRMKLCSRSLIFEPTDQRKPIIKYMFKSFKRTAEQYVLSSSDRMQCSVELSGFFSFRCSGVIEMMDNGKVGPFRLVDFANKTEGTTILFASVHSELPVVISRINQLFNAYQNVERDGAGLEFMSMLAAASTCAFDTSQLKDFHETLQVQEAIPVKKIRPLTVNPGCLMITDRRLYFQPSQLNNVGDPVDHYHFETVSRIYKRRYLLRHTSMELIMNDGSSVFFCFETRQARDIAYDLLMRTMTGSGSQHRRASLNVRNIPLDHVVRQWQRKEISNFDYLMYLNNESDRSMNDLTQYPVFPHVIQDFQSKSLDLKNPSTFRDLSKPIGALNPARLEHFKQRFRTMPEQDDAMGIPPPFLYGTHYSTPGYVLHFLVRVAPEYMLCLQNGKFDAPDRSFLSIADSWASCLNNPADLKELIPEFFTGGGEFLSNDDDLDLGHRHNGDRVGDVDLPPWAKSRRDFIRKHAKALECDHVSAHIHEWIDLIFGYKQQGQEAIDAHNLFYYLTYEGRVDLEKETDPRRRRAFEMQIQEFGQTPKQLFRGPHPARNDHAAEVLLCDKDGIPGSSEAKSSKGKNDRNATLGSPMASQWGAAKDPSQKVCAPISPAQTKSSRQPFSPAASKTEPLAGRKDAHSAEVSAAASGGIVESIFGVFGSPKAASTSSSSAATAVHDKGKSEITAISSMPSAVPQPVVSAGAPSHQLDRRVRRTVRALRTVVSPIAAHSESVMEISVSSCARGVVCSCSKDSYLKVYTLDADASSTASRFSIRRVFAPSDPNPTSACCMSSDGRVVYVGCYDNIIYSYSITNASISGSIQAHDDSVSALDLSKDDKWLLSGSWDASVKIWKVTADGSGHESVLELFEHESPVVSVAINESCTYVAAGAEDGNLVVWAVNFAERESRVSFSKLISTVARRPVTSVKWMSSSSGAVQSQVGFSDERLVCATGDGLVLCLDATGRLFAATRVQNATSAATCGVNALCVDRSGLVYGACADKCVRVWGMEKGFLKEVTLTTVHDSAVTAVALADDENTLVTGGEVGAVCVLKIE